MYVCPSVSTESLSSVKYVMNFKLCVIVGRTELSDHTTFVGFAQCTSVDLWGFMVAISGSSGSERRASERESKREREKERERERERKGERERERERERGRERALPQSTYTISLRVST